MIKTCLSFSASCRMFAMIVCFLLQNACLYAVWFDRTDNGGTITASSQIHEGESKEMAFDNTSSTKWLTGHTATGWIQFQFPNNQLFTITGYSITSADDEPERDPRNWSLLGSYDGQKWYFVDGQVNQSWTGRLQRREFTCDYPNAYHYYRLDVTLNNGAVDLMGFSEMELLHEVFFAESPNPPDMADGTSNSNLLFSWETPTGLTDPEYRIYLSDSLSFVQNSDPSVLLSQQFETHCLVESLDSFTTYYWRVDVVDGDAGNVWQFRTQVPGIECLSPMTDINSDCEIGLPDLAILADQWLSESCPIDQCADLDASSKVDIADLGVMAADWSMDTEAIVLYEIMADNETTLADNFGEYSDWIEIKNLGDTPQNLQGWFLTNDEDTLNEWTFPDVTIGPKEYLIVFASGRDTIDDPNNLHVNFKLDKDGQYLALVHPDMTIAHEFSPSYLSLGNDEAYGLTVLPAEETFVSCLLEYPTPGQNNTAAVVHSKPEFSVDAGIFNDPFTLELSVDDPDVNIRYTLDGSVPTSDSTLYVGPLTVERTRCIRAAAFRDKYLSGKTSTRTYLFPETVIQQPELPDGFPDMWKSTAADYEMDPDIVNHSTYGPQLQESLLALPSISIVTELENLFDSTTGIYANPVQEGVAWERPASVELIYPDNSEGFRIDCGLRIQGGAFRRFDLTKKKSFRLVFKREYGSGKLNYPLFGRDEDATDSFDTITLRAGANDGYSWSTAYLTEQYTRDQFGRSLQRDSGNAGSHGTFMHLYVNGLYWGLYNAVERPDNAFSATYYGGDKDDWDAINSGDVSEGDQSAWNMLIDQCTAGVTSVAAYEKLQGNNPDGSRNSNYPVLIDMDNYIDYIIINMWGGNGDWPWRNYWVGRLRTDESEGFKFYCWDYEGTILGPASTQDKVSADFNSGAGVPHHHLKENAEYRMRFADRLHKLFFNDGIFQPDSLIQRYQEIADWVEPSIIAESARWGDMHHHPPLGLNEWTAERDDILNNYLPTRSDVVLGQMRNAGYYPQVEAPVFKINGVYQNGGNVETADVFSVTGSGTFFQETEMISEGDSVKIYIATDDSLGLGWTIPAFVTDSSWTDGSSGTGVGYERNSGYENVIDTDVEGPMYDKATSVYCRMEFTYTGGQDIQTLVLGMKYDDGFIAYLNGVEVCRSNNITNDTPGIASAANHEASDSYEEFDITAYANQLLVGTNILAIHGINYSQTSSDMLVLPELIVTGNASTPVWYTTDGSDPRLIGGDVNPAAIEYAGPFPLTHSRRIRARTLEDGQWSAVNEAVYSVGPILDNLRVTEIMYHPADPNSEFIELTNVGAESINLNLVRFTKGVDFTFPAIDLASGESAIVIQDSTAFADAYPDFSGTIAGQYTGSLDNSGEKIRLKDALGQNICDFDYKDSWYDMTDGDGFSLTIINPHASDPNLWDDKDGWRPSAVVGGSPGTTDTGMLPEPGSIVINEVLAHSHATAPDWIELYNTTESTINIGGWFLSDSNDDDPNIMKYEIPLGMSIPGGGYKVFYEDLTFGDPSAEGVNTAFGLSEGGDSVYLRSGAGGVVGGYEASESFGASASNIAFGRHIKSVLDGGVNFVAMSANTPGWANVYPKVGPVVISEIMYNPDAANTGGEYIELYNITGAAVPLEDVVSTETSQGVFTTETVPWHFSDGIDFVFPSGTTIPANGYVIIAQDPTAFTAYHGAMPNGVDVLGPFENDTKLSNGGEQIQIVRPGDQEYGGDRYWIRTERVTYDDTAPWPVEADGAGDALHQKTPDTAGSNYGNDVINWMADTPSPGQ